MCFRQACDDQYVDVHRLATKFSPPIGDKVKELYRSNPIAPEYVTLPNTNIVANRFTANVYQFTIFTLTAKGLYEEALCLCCAVLQADDN